MPRGKKTTTTSQQFQLGLLRKQTLGLGFVIRQFPGSELGNGIASGKMKPALHKERMSHNQAAVEPSAHPLCRWQVQTALLLPVGLRPGLRIFVAHI